MRNDDGGNADGPGDLLRRYSVTLTLFARHAKSIQATILISYLTVEHRSQYPMLASKAPGVHRLHRNLNFPCLPQFYFSQGSSSRTNGRNIFRTTIGFPSNFPWQRSHASFSWVYVRYLLFELGRQGKGIAKHFPNSRESAKMDTMSSLVLCSAH